MYVRMTVPSFTRRSQVPRAGCALLTYSLVPCRVVTHRLEISQARTRDHIISRSFITFSDTLAKMVSWALPSIRSIFGSVVSLPHMALRCPPKYPVEFSHDTPWGMMKAATD